MTRLICTAFLATAFACVNSATAEDGYGSVAGQIVFEGQIPPRRVLVKAGEVRPSVPAESVLDESLLIDKKSRGVANVFVWPEKVSSIHPRFQARELQPGVMSCDGFRVEPRCLLVQTGQGLRLQSSSETPWTAHLRTFFNQGWNVLVPARDPGAVTLPPIPIRLTSQMQPWVEAWIRVSDHPYAGLSDSEGNFQINWLPAGDYEFTLWHEKAGYIARRLPVTVRDRKITRLKPLKLTPEL